MRTLARLTIAAAGAAAALLGPLPASEAGSYGEAPWCAVQNLGAGDIEWDCEYASQAQCAPQVIAGNRGFCNVNPRWIPPPGAAGAGRRPHHHHYQG